MSGFPWGSLLRRRLSPVWAVALTLMFLVLQIDISLAQAAPSTAPGAHVFLLRGALNIFSLGMDEIAAKLEKMGIATTVTNYLDWQALANQAAAEYKSAGR